MNLLKLANKPRVFERLFGLSPQRFQALIVELEPHWQAAELERKTSYPRKIAVGGGNQYKLSLAQMTAMYLLYLRTYANHVFLGLVFGLDDSRVCRYFQKLEPVALKSITRRAIKKAPLSETDILTLVVDATEQETERRAGSGYSGKKKKQTVKTQILIDARGAVRHISASVPGNIHDKTLFDATRLKLSRRTKADLGYLGTGLALPHKSSKLHPLTLNQKRYNKRHAVSRIVIEHVFAALKQFRILAHRFHNTLARYNAVFQIVCGLYNLRRA